MTRRRILIAVAAVAALVLPTATPAAAVTVPQYAAPCATGAFTGYAGALDGGAPVVELSGWIRPCFATLPGSKFGFVHYFTEGAVLPIDNTIGTGLMVYATTTGTTDFAVASNLSSDAHADLESQLGPLTAICLIRNRDARLACVAVERPTPDAVPVVTPLAADDERFHIIPLVGQVESGGISPITHHCGNCI